MSDLVGWVLVVVAAVLLIIAYVRYRSIRDELALPGPASPVGTDARRVNSALYSGQLPADKGLAAATRAVARQTLTNYPLRWKYGVFIYPAVILACASLYAFAPSYALPVLVSGVVVAAIVTIQARASYRGAQRILATKK